MSVTRYAFTSALPTPVQPIVDALGANRARVALVLDLLEHPHSTRAEITQRTDIPTHTVYVHLQSLEALGVVSADVDADLRHGRTVHYDADRTRLLADLAALVAQITTPGP